MSKKRLIQIITIVIGAAVVVAAAVGIPTIISRNKTCKIGFYGLSETVTQALTDEITNNFSDSKYKIKLEILDNTIPLDEKKAKKYNAIFSLNGKEIAGLENILKEYPEEIYKLMPLNIAATGKINGKNIVMPILLDHYEIAYYRTYREQCQLGFPQQEEHLKIYLEEIKEKAIFPLYLAGADDETLLGFISLIAESMMSPEAYKQMLLDTYMSLSYDNPLPPELKRALKKTEEMVENQYLYRKWYLNTQADLDFAMKEHKVGSIVTSLSKHRKMPFIIIKYYDSFMYPKATTDSTGIIAPEICAVMINDKGITKQVIETMVHTEIQTALSDATKLAPVNSRAQSHDMQADDVRFMAASTSGPLPSLVEGACSTPAQVKKLATSIREYLQQ